jgi:hypothetical protein
MAADLAIVRGRVTTPRLSTETRSGHKFSSVLDVVNALSDRRGLRRMSELGGGRTFCT